MPLPHQLFEFLAFNCSGPVAPSSSTDPPPQCLVCLHTASTNESHLVQVDLPTCMHIICVDCLIQHARPDHETCPICEQESWTFDIEPSDDSASDRLSEYGLAPSSSPAESFVLDTQSRMSSRASPRSISSSMPESLLVDEKSEKRFGEQQTAILTLQAEIEELKNASLAQADILEELRATVEHQRIRIAGMAHVEREGCAESHGAWRMTNRE